MRKLSDMHVGMNATVIGFEQMATGDTRVALLPLIKKLPQTVKKTKKKQSRISWALLFLRKIKW
ncbi:hypothetical protein OMD49_27925 [Bacillus anthracis]|nr:hypothetical protein [Bacillus anthracis]